MPMAFHLQRRSHYQQLASSTSKAPGRLLEEIPDFGLRFCVMLVTSKETNSIHVLLKDLYEYYEYYEYNGFTEHFTI